MIFTSSTPRTVQLMSSPIPTAMPLVMQASQMGALEAQWRLSNFSREVEHSEENMRYLIQQAGSARFAALERALQ